MNLKQINIIRLQPLQRRIDRIEDSRARESSLIDVVLAGSELVAVLNVQNLTLFTHEAKALGQKNEFVPRYVVLFDHSPDHLLADPVRIDVGCVPGVQTTVIGALEERLHLLFVIVDPWLPVLVAEGHGSQDGNRDAKAGLAQLGVRHFRSLEALLEAQGEGGFSHGARSGDSNAYG